VATHREIRFVSSNQHKISEAKLILGVQDIDVIASPLKIEELQTTDTHRLVHDKVLKAFELIGRRLFVEHTGLYLEYLNGFPGGLTQIFWDSLKADKFADLFGKLSPNPVVIAKTAIAYCDGKKIYDFEGEIAGRIVPKPRGKRDFQWDCVFQPKSRKETFAEMGDRKNDISMRRIALDKLAAHLTSPPRT
jgi:XTP/dITP diphosphohydrolase